ncbi:MAG: Uma2 family endonuclease [Eubacterium sp.]|nr:Uma2 family endonuclease [Eubacterium sp.]
MSENKNLGTYNQRDIDGSIQGNAGKSIHKNSGDIILRDPQEAYKTGIGPYTVEDYYALRGERRVELIDGWIYDMANPGFTHQRIYFLVAMQLENCIREHAKDCVMIPDFGIRLDRDDKTMVEPDIVVLCDSSSLNNRYYDGAPDLAVEVLSPSTRAYDLLRKRYKYQNAGVREYWVIDPQKQEVLVFDFAGGTEDKPEIYPFGGKIAVRISEGICEIDTAEFPEVVRMVEG